MEVSTLVCVATVGGATTIAKFDPPDENPNKQVIAIQLITRYRIHAKIKTASIP
jgi:hypothetical protein